MPRRLSFIHNLQTEMKSQMNALQQGLDTKPAFPQGFPAWRAIAWAGQIASQLSDSRPEDSGGHQRGSLIGLCSYHCKELGIEHLTSATLRLSTCQVAQLQQTDGQRRQQAQQADQTIDTLHLALFETASGFQTLVIVFYNPAMLIPSHPLPSLFERCGGDRGQQNPFQGFFSSGVCSSQTRMAHTANGSLFPRGS